MQHSESLDAICVLLRTQTADTSITACIYTNVQCKPSRNMLCKLLDVRIPWAHKDVCYDHKHAARARVVETAAIDHCCRKSTGCTHPTVWQAPSLAVSAPAPRLAVLQWMPHRHWQGRLHSGCSLQQAQPVKQVIARMFVTLTATALAAPVRH